MIRKYLYQSVLYKGILQCSVFILNLAIARHYGASVSGQFFWLVNFYSFIILFASLSLESGIVYYGTKNEIAPAKLAGFSIAYSVIVIAMSGILLLIADLSHLQINKTHGRIVAIAFIGGNLLASYSNSLFNTRKNFNSPVIVAIVLNLICIIVLPQKFIAWSMSDDDYFRFYFISYIVLGVITFGLFTVRYLQQSRISFPSASEIKKLLSYSLVAWSGNIIFFLVYRIDYFFVEKYCSSGDLGNYMQVSKVGQLFFLLPTIIASVIFPVTIMADKEKMHELLALISRLILFIYLIGCIILVLVGRWLFVTVFGTTYNHMYDAFIFLIPGVLSLSLSYCISAYNAGINKLRINIVSAACALLIIVCGNLVMIPYYSIYAAAGVSSAGYVGLYLYLLLQIKKEGKLLKAPANFFIMQAGDIPLLVSIFKTKKI